jgi:hypothetical protein
LPEATGKPEARANLLVRKRNENCEYSVGAGNEPAYYLLVFTAMKKLVLVAGHAIPYRFDRLDSDEGWYLKHFQAGEGGLYVSHVRTGVELAAADQDALLLFAGGQTDGLAGPRSEGQGYWLVAEYLDWFGYTVRERATTEEFSLDSFQNLLFGLCRFHEVTGDYPESVVAVGWQFKGERFDLHREALRFPASRFEYVGVNDPPELEKNLHFETARRETFVADPYGASEEPVAKRSARNVFRRQHGYAASCPELADLLRYSGPSIYAGPLPWS